MHLANHNAPLWSLIEMFTHLVSPTPVPQLLSIYLFSCPVYPLYYNENTSTLQSKQVTCLSQSSMSLKMLSPNCKDILRDTIMFLRGHRSWRLWRNEMFNKVS